MFVISCKESGCVKLTCTQNPKDVMKLSPNVDTYFNILEFDDNTDYTGKYLKVVNGALNTIGSLKPRLIMIEVVDSAMGLYSSSAQELLKVMNSLGYVPNVLNNNNNLKAYHNGCFVKNDNIFFTRK